MNRRLISVLIFALVVSAAASLILYRLISARLTAAAPRPANHVLMAARNLELGTVVRESDVKVGDWPADIPPGTLTNPSEVVGRGVISPINAGEPIPENRLAPLGAGGGLAATIPPGMRAVAIRVNEVVGVSGFIAPGTRVDVLIAGVPPGGSGGGTVSKTLLQNMEVLSAGTNIQKDAEGKPVQVAVVNLLATPEQAEALSLASNEMRIQFVLRNPVDKEISKTPGTTVANLFTGESGVQMPAAPAPKSKRTPAPQVVKAAPPPPPPPPVLEKVQVPIVVEVIHGTKKTETAFKPSDGEKQ